MTWMMILASPSVARQETGNKMINGFRIRQVRELRGLTQTELAESVGVTQTMIAYFESGRSEPTEKTLDAIALKTGFPPSFFKQETITNFPLGSLLFRAHTSITNAEKQEAHRYAEVLYDMVDELANKVRWRSSTLPRVTDDPVEAAHITRSELGLSPDTPINNLMNSVEKAGAIILAVPTNLEGRDAFSGWAGSDEQRPVIIISNHTAGDRLRLSIAHEIGHLVMHHGLTVNYGPQVKQVERGERNEIEKQAYKFASELLMPEIAMRQEITSPITLSSLAELKPRWKVSIQALIRRAKELEIITERQYTYLNHLLSAKGWKTEEPGKIIPEKPRAIRLIAEKLYGVPINYQKLANDVNLTPQFIRQVFNLYLGKEEILRANNPNTEPIQFSDRNYKS
jgi:Zn-dependent peptidase ImmA (M78 family)/DNA-binding XRE family transcriptional regulator